MSVKAFTLVSVGTDKSLMNWEKIGLLLDASTKPRSSVSTLSKELALTADIYKAEA